ncbi:hypothetical protein LZ198_26175 [Myxococcus sp. K15C18031901]|uniref:hypothetical protein n=1 Tax=Myxococcus dinghuensis TaxID=2906761 RepID=UPI0020A7AC9C|nr:hypothetical protein [Myxococcus dinghuensis]MCP3102364.1 hypothetical protein [Myxococcus dinghuensis]
MDGRPGSLGRLLALRGRLGFESQPDLLAEVAEALRARGADAGLAWLEVAAALPPGDQVSFLSALRTARVPGLEARAYDLAIEPQVASRPGWRVRYLEGLAMGLDADYLLTGFRLLNRWESWETRAAPLLPDASGFVPEASLDVFAARLAPGLCLGTYLGILWRLCGALPGFGASLESIPWRSLTVEAAGRFSELLTTLWSDSVPVDVGRRRWRRARTMLPRLLGLLERVPPEHQARCIEWVHWLVASPNKAEPWSASEECVSAVLVLAERCRRPPFLPRSQLPQAVEPLLHHPEARVRERLLALPERVLRRFERCCVDENQGALVWQGISVMMEHASDLVLDAWGSNPELLARSAALVGTLRAADARALLVEFAQHPWVRENPFTAPEVDGATLARAFSSEGLENPFPRKARLAWTQARVLSPGQQARALQVAASELPRLRLQLLVRACWRWLRGTLTADTREPVVQHALRMAALLQDNRRPFRRFLARYFAGTSDPVRHHPLSRDWFLRHPRVDEALWLRGLTVRREVPGMGAVTLALEQEPLEALRLGTHVGSCLALNGLCDYSAVSAVLDANKRVLYARDSRGRVVARQLLAISRDETLVPFAVYPERVEAGLRDCFLDYDLAFADALGLPLSDGPEFPDVESLWAQSFWHDGAWDLGGREPQPSSSRGMDRPASNAGS